MTAQIGEQIKYQGVQLTMCTTPLSDYFRFGGDRPDFQAECTALWRGYVGRWEIVDNRLYLVGLYGILKDDSEASLETVFPDHPDRVFAHWYSGILRIPQGKLLNYEHAGFASTYEKDLLLSVKKGVITSENTRHNGTSENSDLPEGYGIGGMTVFNGNGR